MKMEIRPGATLWRNFLGRDAQETLLAEVLERVADAPLYRASMPRTGKPLSVEMTNFGSLGWYSDVKGYRYEAVHPLTGRAWPRIPPSLLVLWEALSDYPAEPESCLVNLYRGAARMGLHQDRNEKALDAPVLSVSLGDSALYRIGDPTPGGRTASLLLNSGDVVLMGGPARLCRHGIDRIRAGSDRLVPGGGRINLTLRRVTRPTCVNIGLK